MHYKVIHFFTDLQDFDHPYNAGDIFPREGLMVSKDRLKELSGPNNRQRKPLIELVKEENTVVVEYTKTEINRMPVSELKEIALKEEIEDFDKKTGAELKKLLIKKLGL